MKFKLLNTKALNSRGLAHYVMPLIVVVLVAVGGTFMLVASHADSSGCPKGYKMVNATPAEFSDSTRTYKHPFVCVPKSSNRPRVIGANSKTIQDFFYCNPDSTFAFDKNNKNGTGYHSPWQFQAYFGGTSYSQKTYYCIKTDHLYMDRAQDGTKIGPLRIKNNLTSGIPGHKYNFNPAFDLRNGCTAHQRERTNCNPHLIFIYNGDRIRVH